MNLVKIISTTVTAGKRVVKFLRLGGADVQTSVQVAPYGVDSNPIKGMVAVYGQTGTKGKTVIIGYINLSSIAQAGEHRTYSTDENGQVKTYIHLKNDGTMEIGGNADNMVRYSGLDTAFHELQASHNNLVAAFNLHSHASNGAPPTAVPGSIPASESGADITPAKIEEIKTL